MERFGNVSIARELNGVSIHRLENVITMEMGMHSLFDLLAFWFEETVRSPCIPVYFALESSKL
jgi:hypothetical protein